MRFYRRFSRLDNRTNHRSEVTNNRNCSFRVDFGRSKSTQSLRPEPPLGERPPPRSSKRYRRYAIGREIHPSPASRGPREPDQTRRVSRVTLQKSGNSRINKRKIAIRARSHPERRCACCCGDAGMVIYQPRAKLLTRFCGKYDPAAINRLQSCSQKRERSHSWSFHQSPP
jgi:hypothetical protein